MNVSQIDSWEPDYTQVCEVCGAGHVVTGVRKGAVVYQGTQCGVCTWGEADMADPDNWNKSND